MEGHVPDINDRSSALMAPIRLVSILNIVLWAASSALQTAVLVLFEAGMSVFAVSSLDKVAAGIWSSVFYLIAGLLGFSLSHVPTHTKVKATALFAGVSILTAIAATTISAIVASKGVNESLTFECRYAFSQKICDDYVTLEWSLMGSSLLAVVENVLLFAMCLLVIRSKVDEPEVVQTFQQQAPPPKRPAPRQAPPPEESLTQLKITSEVFEKNITKAAADKDSLPSTPEVKKEQQEITTQEKTTTVEPYEPQTTPTITSVQTNVSGGDEKPQKTPEIQST